VIAFGTFLALVEKHCGVRVADPAAVLGTRDAVERVLRDAGFASVEVCLSICLPPCPSIWQCILGSGTVWCT
jgi:hypothetical protein